MRTFPGSFPPAVFDALDLDRYAEAYGLAIEIIEAGLEYHIASAVKQTGIALPTDTGVRDDRDIGRTAD